MFSTSSSHLTRASIYQELFYKVFCLGKKIFWKVIFQLYYLLEYKIFISAKEKEIALVISSPLALSLVLLSLQHDSFISAVCKMDRY